MEIEDLALNAESIFEGRVLAARALRDERGLVRTEYIVSVERTFAGQPLGTRTFELPGGTLPDGSGTVIAGMPSVRVGEDVLLFLTEASANGLRMPVGLAQGKFALVRDAAGELGLLRSAVDLSLLDPRTRTAAPAPVPNVVSYEAVVQRVRTALAAKAEGR